MDGWKDGWMHVTGLRSGLGPLYFKDTAAMCWCRRCPYVLGSMNDVLVCFKVANIIPLAQKSMARLKQRLLNGMEDGKLIRCHVLW